MTANRCVNICTYCSNWLVRVFYRVICFCSLQARYKLKERPGCLLAAAVVITANRRNLLQHCQIEFLMRNDMSCNVNGSDDGTYGSSIVRRKTRDRFRQCPAVGIRNWAGGALLSWWKQSIRTKRGVCLFCSRSYVYRFYFPPLFWRGHLERFCVH